MAHRRKSFRPRPFDPFNEIQVIRDATVFNAISEEDPGTLVEIASSQDKDKKKKKQQQTVPGTLTEQLKVDEGKSEEKKFSLPVPETAKTNTFDQFVPSTFVPRPAYFRHRLGFTNDYTLSGDTEYELTLEDEEWIDQHPVFGPKGKFPVSHDTLEKMIDILERKTGRDVPVSESQVPKLFQKHLGDAECIPKDPSLSKKLASEVHKWWINRRQELRKPLLRRFWPITAPNDTDPNQTFRPREKERYRLRNNRRQNDLESFEKLVAIKSDFEMVKSLLQLVRRREHLRMLEAKLLEEEFEQALSDLVNPSATQQEGDTPPWRVEIGDEASIGPLPKDIVDHVFEINKLVVSSSTTSTSTSLLSSSFMGNDGASEIDIENLDSDLETKKKKKKKKKKKDASSALTPATSSIASSGGVGGALASGSSSVVDSKSGTPPKSSGPFGFLGAAGKPIRPQDFLIDKAVPYINAEYEVYYPIIPTWPPAYPTMLRKQLQVKPSGHQQTSSVTVGSAVGERAVTANTVGELGDSSLEMLSSGNKDGDILKNDELATRSRERGGGKGLANSLKFQVGRANSQASSKKDTVKFRYRPRIGRGGRYIVDRIPVHSHSSQSAQPVSTATLPHSRIKEVYAGPDPFETGQEFLDPCKSRGEISHELFFPSRPPPINANQRSKIQAIYIQEDSEDEEVEILDYPYLAPLQMTAEDAVRLEASAMSQSLTRTVKEPKFRFII